MPEPTVYKLYLQPGLKILLGLILVIFVGVGVFFISWPLDSPDPKAPPLVVGLLWLAVVAINLVYFLSLPHRITLAGDGTIEFLSLLRRRLVRAQEIRSIRPASSQLGFFMVRTDGGKIRVMAQFDGFHDFLARLKAINPAVELRGC